MYQQRYPHLFQPLKVKGLTFKNRIMSAPNMLFQTVNGLPTEYHLRYLEHKARGGAAQVTLGECPICDGGAHTPGTELTENALPVISEISAAIKEHGAIASVEITHGGVNCKQRYNTKPIMGPVAGVNKVGDPIKEMTRQDMEDVANAFANATAYWVRAGFDTVLIHAAHGWLFPQFLSPLVNTRTDEFGGSLENRMRFPLMCLERARDRVGPKQVIEMRLSGSSRNEEDFSCDDIIAFLERAQEYVDLVEISAEGVLNFMASTYRPHMIQVDLSEKIKRSGRVHIPVFVIGSILSPEEAEDIIASGKADGVSLSRALIADPYFPKKAQTGRADEIVPCLRCLHCTDHDNAFRHFDCSVNPLAGREARLGFLDGIGTAKRRQRVLVVGGGPAGMSAAVTAAKRGHEVILCEKSGQLGGLLNFTDRDSLKHDLRRYKEFLVRQTENAAVRILLNTEADDALVETLQPDHILVAAGSSPIVPTFITGYEHARHALDVYRQPELLDGVKQVVMIGGGLVGMECGMHLANLGKSVTVLELGQSVAPEAGNCYGIGMRAKAAELGVQTVTGAKVQAVEDGGVRYEKDGAACHMDADAVFYAVGMTPNSAVYDALCGKAPEVTLIGDCKQVGQVVGAVHGGFFAAMDIGTL
ncbi:MAG: FAD-dependent oxidoreductase [Oscillospiraceae bacterium]|nr:FAD-dependent oxidoreductase [Oscillospiraceae bacterium]